MRRTWSRCSSVLVDMPRRNTPHDVDPSLALSPGLFRPTAGVVKRTLGRAECGLVVVRSIELDPAVAVVEI